MTGAVDDVEESIFNVVADIVRNDGVTPARAKQRAIVPFYLRKEIPGCRFEVIDHTFSAVPDLISSPTRPDAEIDIFPAILVGQVQAAEFVPDLSPEKRAGCGNDLKAS